MLLWILGLALGGYLLMAARASNGVALPGAKSMVAKAGEIWRFDSVVSPAPPPAEQARIKDVLKLAALRMHHDFTDGAGWHVVYDQQIPTNSEPVVFQVPSRFAVKGAQMLMLTAKRVG